MLSFIEEIFSFCAAVDSQNLFSKVCFKAEHGDGNHKNSMKCVCIWVLLTYWTTSNNTWAT